MGKVVVMFVGLGEGGTVSIGYLVVCRFVSAHLMIAFIILFFLAALWPFLVFLLCHSLFGTLSALSSYIYHCHKFGIFQVVKY